MRTNITTNSNVWNKELQKGLKGGEIEYQGRKWHIVMDTYNGRRVRITLHGDCDVIEATLDIPVYPLPVGHVLLKTPEFVGALEAINIIKDTGYIVDSKAYLCRLKSRERGECGNRS